MTSVPNPLGLSQLEIASNLVPGPAPAPLPLPRNPTSSPRVALEVAIARALARTPCVVSFSGGRDSSAVLALAVHVARRDGFELPIPVTLRFPGVQQADEASWQEVVVRHLGVSEWEQITVTDELDMLGPHAQTVLTRCGLLWPANSYLHEPILRRAAGGSLVTGADGDGLFGLWRWQRHADVLAGRRPRRLADMLRLVHPLSPVRIRRTIARNRGLAALPYGMVVPEWLRPAAARAAANAARREMAEEPFLWGRRVRWYATRRYPSLMRESFQLMASGHDVVVRHLFMEPEFLAAMARHSKLGPGGRTSVMAELFGDLLPTKIVSRTSKALFGEALAGGYSREFMVRWSGRDIDPGVVDGEVLSMVWREDMDPGRHSMLLLHSIWLASRAQGRREQVDDLIHGVPPPRADQLPGGQRRER